MPYQQGKMGWVICPLFVAVKILSQRNFLVGNSPSSEIIFFFIENIFYSQQIPLSLQRRHLHLCSQSTDLHNGEQQFSSFTPLTHISLIFFFLHQEIQFPCHYLSVNPDYLYPTKILCSRTKIRGDQPSAILLAPQQLNTESSLPFTQVNTHPFPFFFSFFFWQVSFQPNPRLLWLSTQCQDRQHRCRGSGSSAAHVILDHLKSAVSPCPKCTAITAWHYL